MALRMRHTTPLVKKRFSEPGKSSAVAATKMKSVGVMMTQ
jgi:hypothetical protein